MSIGRVRWNIHYISYRDGSFFAILDMWINGDYYGNFNVYDRNGVFYDNNNVEIHNADELFESMRQFYITRDGDINVEHSFAAKMYSPMNCSIPHLHVIRIMDVQSILDTLSRFVSGDYSHLPVMYIVSNDSTKNTLFLDALGGITQEVIPNIHRSNTIGICADLEDNGYIFNLHLPTK